MTIADYGFAIWETFYVTVLSTAFSLVIGLPLGVLLVITRRGGIRPMPTFNAVAGAIVNFLRSIPFIILLAMLFPVTRVVMGRAIGTVSVIFPLTVSAFPYVARMVEGSFNEVDNGIIEAAQSMGSTNRQIIFKVLLPEALPSLISGAAIVTTNVLGYSAMAGFVGGGGLGTIAVNYGVYRYQTDVMLVTLAMLVIIVQLFQELGMRIATRIDKRRK